MIYIYLYKDEDIYQVILQTTRTEGVNNYTGLKVQVFQAFHVNQTLCAPFVHAQTCARVCIRV